MLLISVRKNGAAVFSDCVVVFLGTARSDAASIDEEFYNWTLNNVSPPTVLIVGSAEHIRDLANDSSADDRGVRELPRISKHSQVFLAEFLNSGVIKTVGFDQESIDVTEIFYSAVNEFISQYIDNGELVIPAPPGFHFDKLSGRFSSHFIRAETLLDSSSAIELMALRLLAPFDAWWRDQKNGSDAIGIFIDTMGVWPIAEKLIQMHSAHLGELQEGDNTNQRKVRSYAIESFKSYGGLENWDAGYRLPFVLISASTSGGLAAQVEERIGRVEIWTIIALSPDARNSQPVRSKSSKDIYMLARQLNGASSLHGLRTYFETDLKVIPAGDETISIVGERFLNESAKPKRVRLTSDSLTKEIKQTLSDLARAGLVRIARGRFDGQSRWTISFDYEKLFAFADERLKEWLRNYSSPGPVAIVYPSPDGAAATAVSEAAIVLAHRIKYILKDLLPNTEITCLSSNQLANATNVDTVKLAASSFVIAAPAIGNGFTFKQIAAELRRLQPTGPRLFIALAVLPESQALFTQLKSDITLDGDDRSYIFKWKFCIPIGRLDSAASWQDESVILSLLDETLPPQDLVSALVSSRVDELDGMGGLSTEHVFLSSGVGASLPLSTGFFLWPGSTEIHGTEHGGAVLLSIAALLQASRVSASTKDQTSLKTGLFQHALLCPETFTRFNDPVIQAALLRAAYPAELNYSVSPSTSSDMARLILKWLDYADRPVGAACPEFLLAIAINKLRLCDKDLVRVLDKAVGSSIGMVKCLGEIARNRLIA